MENKDIGLILLVGGAIWYMGKNTGSVSQNSKRTALINLISDSGEDPKVFYQMTDQEISDSYAFIFNYVNKGIKLSPDNPLWQRIDAIRKKYNIFT